MKHAFITLSRYCCAIILCFTAITSYADTIARGVILATDGDPVTGAIIKIKNGEGKTIAFGSSNEKGAFNITLKSQILNAFVEIACLGYKKESFPVESFAEQLTLTIQEEAYNLKEVVVKVPPISASNDTLTYNVDSFRSAADRNIEDIIKRLPGIEVSGNGQISYNGEKINKFYIEDLDLLQGRYAIATKNISPDDVQSVNVYENHQPIQALQDTHTSRQAAINLKLKKRSILRPIVNVSAGAGYGNHKATWLAELFGMLIAARSQTIVTAKGNNFAQSYEHELIDFSYNSPLKENTVAFNVFPKILYNPEQLSTQRYYKNTSASASVNHLQKTGQYSTLNFNADYLKDEFSYNNLVDIEYFGTGTNVINVKEDCNSHISSHTANAKLKFERNAPTGYLSNETYFRARLSNSDYSIISDKITEQLLKTNDFSFANNLHATIKSGQRAININSKIFVATTPDNQLFASHPEEKYIVADQTATGLTFTTANSTGLGWSLSKAANAGATLHFNTYYDKFHSLRASDADIEPARNNDIYGYKLHTKLTPYINLHLGDVTWNTQIPISLYNMQYIDQITDSAYIHNHIYVGVNTTFRYTLPYNIRTSLTFSKEHALGGINNLIQNPIFTTYRMVSTIGNGALNIRDEYKVAFDASYRNTVEGLFWNFNAGFSHSKNNRMISTSITDSISHTTSIQANNPSNRFTLLANASKLVQSISTTFRLGTNIITMSRKSQRQGNIYSINTAVYAINGTIQSTPIKGRLSFSLNATQSFSTQSFSQAGLNSETLANTTLRINVSVVPYKRWELYVDGEYDNIAIPKAEKRQQTLFLDAGAKYSFKKFQFDLRCRNITNRKHYTFATYNSGDTYYYQYQLRPVEFLLVLKYKI